MLSTSPTSTKAGAKSRKAGKKSPRQQEGNAQATSADADAKKKGAPRLADARARMYHDLIFESAECVFGRNGYDGATMQEIADEAGISLKTLYATYESKQDLFEQIMRVRAGSFVERMREAAADEEEPLARLARLVDAYVAFLFDHEDWLRIHLRSRVAWTFRPPDEEVAEAWVEGRDVYTGMIRQGVEQGVFFDGDAEEMGALAQSIMQVQMSRAIDLEHKDPAEVAGAIMLHLRRLLCPRQVE